MKKYIFIILLCLGLTGNLKSQAPAFILNDIGELTPKNSVEKLKEEQAKTLFIEKYIENHYKNNVGIADTTKFSYIIPVVFHVYGTESPAGTVMQNGSPVNIEVIQSALDELNKDFKGLNADFTTVHNAFQSRRGTLSIEFRLAKLDPNGNPTNGMVIHPKDASYAKDNGSETIPEVANDAWDNFKYVNIYVQADWSGSGVYNLSGIAWGPDLNMSKNKMARICYNGRYLGSNCSLSQNGYFSEFTGVFTHEFGHFFDLAHLFVDGSCHDATVSDNDGVPDTPNSFNGEGCHKTQDALYPNCPFAPGKDMPQGDSPNSSLCNAENYMTYNNCYKMFTVGQVGRMINALNHPARKTLWQDSNLFATGVKAKPYLNISRNQINIGAKSDSSIKIAINSNTNWVIQTIQYTWISVNKLNGINNDTINLTALENPGTNQRYAQITVYGDGVLPQLILVFQEANLSDVNTEGIMNFSISPNPASNIIKIKVDENLDYQSEIIDMLGQSILSSRNQNEIDVSSLNNGMYFLKIVQSNKSIILKFVKN